MVNNTDLRAILDLQDLIVNQLGRWNLRKQAANQKARFPMSVLDNIHRDRYVPLRDSHRYLYSQQSN